MRIVHLTSAHPWSDTRIFTRMCKSLAQDGNEVHLVVPISQPPHQSLRGDVTIHAIPPARGRIDRMTRTCLQIFWRARRLKPDIYHFHDPELIPTGLMLRFLGNRVVYDIHEHVAADVATKKYLPACLRKLVSNMVSGFSTVAIRRFSGIVTAGEDITESVERDARLITTICNYPDLTILDRCLQSSVRARSDDAPPNSATSDRGSPAVKGRQAVFFGGVRTNDVALNIVKAIGAVPESYDVRLLLGGPVNDTDHFHAITQLPGWKRTTHVGNVDFEEMIRQCDGAACAFTLYANESNAQNIRSNRLFESMALGLPVITSNFPIWLAFVDEHRCGIAVNPEDPREIANAVMYLLDHPDESHEMGQRGRKLVESSWNWQAEYSRLTAFYQRVVDASELRS